MRKKIPEQILMPGDKGFNDPSLPWSGVRNLTGQKKPEGVSLEIHGFYLVDKRCNPPIAIFKNCQFVMQRDTRAWLKEEPKPFQYLGEVLAYRDKMHLSSSDERLVRPTALVPAPGIGSPRPDVLFFSKAALKEGR